MASRLSLPRLGLGTWRMGEHAASRADEVRALLHGIDLGLNLIDTAEMYADAERVVGEALASLGPSRREGVTVVSKVYPWNATYDGAIAACERSLAALGTERIDLYLLHWPGAHPIAETLRAFERLVERGDIRAFGVSNFDVDEMDEALDAPGGAGITTNQILYNLSRRGPERRVLPQLRAQGVVPMAYSPLEQDRLPWTGVLDDVARELGATPRQVALAWTLREPDVVTVVKSSRVEHVDEIAAARDLVLPPAVLATLDAAFPVPDHAGPLECL